jgi:murein DD-endopeptidase MepM/ murein hydrolase activator NlpD
MMQVIIISPKSKAHRHFHLSKRVAFASFLVLLTIGYSLILWGKQSATTTVIEQSTQQFLPVNTSSLTTFTSKSNPQSNHQNDFLAKRLGELQAESIRIKAITDQLAEMSGLDITAFETPKPVAGGIESGGESLSTSELETDLETLQQGYVEQRNKLTELQKYLLTRSSIKSSIPSGKPVQSGWVSSFYGKRIDPFSGKKAFHRGIDVAGKEGTGVIAVADGMVTWIGERGGYGGLVEIDHGNGYVTRYAHNKTIKVALGELVSKGQVIALMGSTGRSTGPHVHFEVLHDGKNVNPYNFIKK